jgi:hypothetical protein
MKQYLDKYPYAVTSSVFLVVLIIGAVRFGWGQFVFAYFALFYCIVIIGIKLDEIAGQVRDLVAVQTTLRKEPGSRGVLTHEILETQRLNDQLGDIKVLLEQIHQSLERTPKTPE